MSQQKENVRFYEDRIKAHTQFYASSSLRDRLTQPSFAFTFAAILFVLIVAFPGYYPIIDRLFALGSQYLFDGIVHVIPRPILNYLDNLEASSETSPPMTTFSSQSAHASKSEALRRILGLNRPGGIMAGVLRARKRAFSATGNALGFKTENDQPPGLGNVDYSCYQNSILQSFASLQPLREYLSNCSKVAEHVGDDKALAQTLKTLVADLTDTANNGKTLWTPQILKSMSSFQQQDASEYFSKVLDDIDKGIAKAINGAKVPFWSELDKDLSRLTVSLHEQNQKRNPGQLGASLSSEAKKLRNPLEGLTAQRVACTSCGYTEGFSMTTFNCLMLSLDDRNGYNVYERMDSFASIEFLDGVHCPKCTLVKAQRLLTRLVATMEEKQASPMQLEEPKRRLDAVEIALEEEDFEDSTLMNKCKISTSSKVNTKKTKQAVIARPPQSLAIHINRSVFDKTTFDLYKNSAPVYFPTTLDLGPWCLGSAAQTTTELGAIISESDVKELWMKEQWLATPTKSMVAGSTKASRMEGPIYELRAVVTHAGRHENGHYICYRKHSPLSEPKSAGAVGESLERSADNVRNTSSSEEYDDNEHAPDTELWDDEGEWWRLSDENVSRVNEEDVLDLASGVFMLFYDCVVPEIVLKPKTPEEENSALERESATREGASPTSDTATSSDVPAASTPNNEDSASTVSPSEAGTWSEEGMAASMSSVQTLPSEKESIMEVDERETLPNGVSQVGTHDFA